MSIVFVTLMMFSVLGYYGILIGIQYQTKSDLIGKMDADDVSDEETFTIKVPMAVPYHVDAENYKRVDGEIEHQGEVYRLVKQKLANDTLYIVCLKDQQSKHIKVALKDYVKTFSDKPADAKQTTKNLLSLMKDYLPTAINVSSSSPGWSYSLSAGWTEDSIQNLSLSIPSPPPKA